MQTVGVDMLRENLTDYLKKVADGEQISITSQGHEVALLVPPDNKFEEARKALDALRKTAFVGDVLSPVSEDWELLK